MRAVEGLVGQTIDKYRLIRVLGSGGMGVVFFAENVLIGKKVAIKLLNPALGDNAEAIERFLREARAVAAIDHPGVVDIYDVGRFERDGQVIPFLVMEVLKGQSLGSFLEHEGPVLEVETAVDITCETLLVLMAVHNKGIVHRDLKPENIFLCLDRDGGQHVKVLDFGISKVRSPFDVNLTQSGTVLGTPCYMSPEQARGDKDLDARVDLWAMGVILYRMVTGQLAFSGDSYNEVLAKILARDFRKPREVRPTLPEWLEEVVLGAMAWERVERYRSAGQFLGDLRSRLELAKHAGDAPAARPAGLDEPASARQAPEASPISQTLLSQDATETVAAPAGGIPSTIPGMPAPRSDAAPPAGPARPAGSGPDEAPGAGEAGEAAASPAADSVAVTTPGRPSPTSPPDWAVGAGGLHLASDKAREALAPAGDEEPGQAFRTSARRTLALVTGAVLTLGIGATVALFTFDIGGGEASPGQAQAGVEPVTEVRSKGGFAPAPAGSGPATAPESGGVVGPLQPPDAGGEPEAANPTEGPRPGEKGVPSGGDEAQGRSAEGPSKEELARFRSAISDEVRRCLGLVGAAPPVVSVKVGIADSGAASLQGAEPSPPAAVEGCLRRAVTRARFQPAGGSRRSVTLSFRTAPPPAPPAEEPRQRSKRRLRDNPFYE
jgi:serine/threonine-protein kinase